MLNKDRYIGELYDLEHRFDSKTNRHYAYEENLLKRTTSPYMWKNENMNKYLENLEDIVVIGVEEMDYARNFFNYTVDKFYNDYYG
jgi:cytochrome c2